jgi:hypothetical protein
MPKIHKKSNKKTSSFNVEVFLCPEQDSNLHILANAAT